MADYPDKDDILAAITEAVLAAIEVVGIEGVRKMSWFPSSVAE